MTSGSADLDVAAYARISVALSEGTSPRNEVLAAHGLDEDAWATIENTWQDRLSRAIDEQDGEAIPPLLVEYDAALREARANASSDDAMSFERFADAARQLQTAGNPVRALAAVGVSFAEFLRASSHWTARMATDPDLAERFRRLTTARGA